MDEQSLKSRRNLGIFFLIVGASYVAFGALFLPEYISTNSMVALGDVTFNALVGLLLLAASWLVFDGKFIVVVFPIFYATAVIIYWFAMGRGFSYFALFYPIVTLPWILSLRKNNALS